jgi:hypothetical protein
VRGEWSLMALCYNFTRVLNILGFEGFAACMAKLAPLGPIQAASSSSWERSGPIYRSGSRSNASAPAPSHDQHYLPSLGPMVK